MIQKLNSSPELENHRSEGDKSIHFLNFKNFKIKAIEATGKRYCGKSPKFEATHQFQVKMLLLLHLQEKFLQIQFEVI